MFSASFVSFEALFETVRADLESTTAPKRKQNGELFQNLAASWRERLMKRDELYEEVVTSAKKKVANSTKCTMKNL